MLAPLDLLAAPGDFSDAAVGWAAFADLRFWGQMSMVLALAVGLAAILAYHPVTRRKASTIEEIEQPKTFIMYAMVGALIALIVKIQPNMALVVFGIGGLMRFRTNVGEAKDTGRVILVTVVGLCCGLELYVVAVLATVVGWILIFALENQAVERIVVQGLDVDTLPGASAAYGEALRELGCQVLGEQKRVKKGTITLTYRAPRGVDRVKVEERIRSIPDANRGTVDWEAA